MPQYLLSTQALADVTSNDTSAINRWAAAQDLADDDVVASVASFAIIKRGIERLEAAERSTWRRLFDAKLELFRRYKSIRPVGVEIALRAAELDIEKMRTVVHDREEPVGDMGVLVVATALEEQLTLVERRQPYHARLESEHRLTVVDPYQS